MCIKIYVIYAYFDDLYYKSCFIHSGRDCRLRIGPRHS